MPPGARFVTFTMTGSRRSVGGMMTFTKLAPAPSDLPEPFTDRLRLAVAAYLARFNGSSREHTESDHGPILLNGRGTRMDRHAATRRLRRLAGTAGLRAKAHPHMLRHTFVTTMLDAGVDLRDVQIAARHADPRTTMRSAKASPHQPRPPRTTSWPRTCLSDLTSPRLPGSSRGRRPALPNSGRCLRTHLCTTVHYLPCSASVLMSQRNCWATFSCRRIEPAGTVSTGGAADDGERASRSMLNAWSSDRSGSATRPTLSVGR